MKNFFQKFIVVGMVLFSANTAMGMDNEIKIGVSEVHGKYLTDAKGMTLYWHVEDTVGKSMCSDSCLVKWPAYYRESIVAPSGITVNDFGEIKREDGGKQTTFRGYPLYYNVNDLDPGDINRQWGLGLIVKPDNFPPKQDDSKK